ncbi:uridine phosphorylase 1 [Drosophila nasuta]|uniref:uridine phosphorylase 1 n=1 Tax=Drosophila nasuta TaxID=42062 RepID=UPI00295EEC6A|nr:uridine phosphorylase 1 [Drosophila nasuta]
MSSCTSSLAKDVGELKAMMKAQNKRIDTLIKHIKEGCEAKEEAPPESTMSNMNPYIECLNPDILYHLALSTDTTDFPKMFGDVRFVCMGGTAARMLKFANFIMKEIGLKMNSGVKLKDLAEDANRYALYKVGPVLCASHGIGGPSISILLHELIKIMHHAKCQNPVFFRMGTSGGINIEPGSVVITSEALDGQLRPVHEVVVHTVPELRPAKLDRELAQELKSLSDPCHDGYDTIIGKTLCANDFYEGQSRLDGAFCSYTPEKKKAFLEQVAGQGVLNMEMESTAFAAITNQAGIRSAVVCVTILDRLESDQITTPLEILKEWDSRPQTLIARYMQKVLFDIGDEDCSGSESCDCAGGDQAQPAQEVQPAQQAQPLEQNQSIEQTEPGDE